MTHTTMTETAARPMRVAFVRARWHAEIVDEALAGFRAALPAEVGVDVIDVPGALEIPLAAQRLARAGRHEAIVGAAFVVDGGIYRHDFVAGTVLDGLMRVGLDADLPVLSVVLTPHQFQETAEHKAFFRSHFRLKGAEAAAAAMAVIVPSAPLAVPVA